MIYKNRKKRENKKMRIQRLNYPNYNTSFCANQIKKTSQKEYLNEKNDNHTYSSKMLAAALAMAAITTGCNINSNKHELLYEKEKCLKSEILTQTNRKYFEKNDSIIKDISSQDSIKSHFQLLNQLDGENRNNRSFRISKVNDSIYETKMKLNDRVITTELNLENQLTPNEYNGKMRVENLLTNEANTFDYKMEFTPENYKSFTLTIMSPKTGEEFDKYRITRNESDSKLFIEDKNGEIVELTPKSLSELPRYSQRDFDETFKKRGYQMEDVKSNLISALAIVGITCFVVGLGVGALTNAKDGKNKSEKHPN